MIAHEAEYDRAVSVKLVAQGQVLIILGGVQQSSLHSCLRHLEIVISYR